MIETREWSFGDYLALISLSIVSLLLTLFVDPFVVLFRRTTLRYKYLEKLEVADLCKELVSGGELSFDEEKIDWASDHEMTKIAHHISMLSARGLSESVPELLSVYEYPIFWMACNRHAEGQRDRGIRVGFYLATIIAVAIYLFGTSLNS